MSTELTKILRKMCRMVKADFKSIDFKKPRWYTEYHWTRKEEEKFVNWLADLLYKNKKVSKLFSNPPTTKRMCKFHAEAFVANFGWTYEHTHEQGRE